MKRILINAAQHEELRVALVDGQRLYDLDIEFPNKARQKANIYKGVVTSVEPSLEAAFVDFGGGRQGFLPWKEISDQYRHKSDQGGNSGKSPIREGSAIIVQVAKEERGSKGATLTTFVSLAGRYLVLMPNNPKLGGISRRIEGDERSDMKESLRALDIPDNMGLIVRTAGVGKDARELQWDLEYLTNLWQAIQDVAGKKRAPFLIHEESNVVLRTIRDYLRGDIAEVLFDTSETYEEALQFVRQVMPKYESRIKFYEDKLPLFNRYQIENQIETAFGRDVTLPSGGNLSIDPTEALVAIDINSARATRGADIQETALNTNLEAADEIARQLRLRDIGGLIVIDFIDMSSNQHQRLVENRMREALEADRARVQVGRISRFGLLEMSRQRLRASLDETSTVVCPRCNGLGRVRDVKSLALSIMRVLGEAAGKHKNRAVHVHAPLDVAAFLLNEKRDEITEIEEESGSAVAVYPTVELVTPHYKIVGIDREGEEYAIDNTEPVASEARQETERRKPALSQGKIADARPQRPASGPLAFLGSAFRSLFGGGETSAAGAKRETPAPGRSGRQRSGTSAPARERGGEGRQRGSARGRSSHGEKRAAADSAKREKSPRKDSAGRGGRSGRQPSKTREPAAAESRKTAKPQNESGGEEQQASSTRAKRRPAAKRPRNNAQRKRGPRVADVRSEEAAANETIADAQAAPAPQGMAVDAQVDAQAAAETHAGMSPDQAPAAPGEAEVKLEQAETAAQVEAQSAKPDAVREEAVSGMSAPTEGGVAESAEADRAPPADQDQTEAAAARRDEKQAADSAKAPRARSRRRTAAPAREAADQSAAEKSAPEQGVQDQGIQKETIPEQQLPAKEQAREQPGEESQQGATSEQAAARPEAETDPDSVKQASAAQPAVKAEPVSAETQAETQSSGKSEQDFANTRAKTRSKTRAKARSGGKARRNSAKTPDKAQPQVAPEQDAAEAQAEAQAEARPAKAPVPNAAEAKAEPPAKVESKEDAVKEQTEASARAQPEQDSGADSQPDSALGETAEAPFQGRAPNDPREVRRRQVETETPASG